MKNKEQDKQKQIEELSKNIIELSPAEFDLLIELQKEVVKEGTGMSLLERLFGKRK